MAGNWIQIINRCTVRIDWNAKECKKSLIMVCRNIQNLDVAERNWH